MLISLARAAGTRRIAPHLRLRGHQLFASRESGTACDIAPLHSKRQDCGSRLADDLQQLGAAVARLQPLKQMIEILRWRTAGEENAKAAAVTKFQMTMPQLGL